MRPARAVLIAIGAALLGYGAWLLVQLPDLGQVGDVAVWAAVGIVLHDVVLAPAVLALGWLSGRVLPPRADDVPSRIRAVAVVVLVVLGPVTLLAIPALGQFGADPARPTLLERDYAAGWIALAVAVVVAATLLVLTGLVTGLRSETGDTGGRSSRASRPRG